MMMPASTFRPVVVVPVYNHDLYLPTLVRTLVDMGLTCILVDDASSSCCARVIDDVVQHGAPHTMLVRHEKNQGKGGAVLSGIRRAAQEGYTHVLQIDADGQHAVADVPRMLEIARAEPDALVTGQPEFDASVPRVRLYLRYLTHFMVSVNTLNPQLRDAMCGFRVYPVHAVLNLAREVKLGLRMDFDIEIVVRLDWAGVPIVMVPTPVRYPVDGISHFHLFSDNARITSLHTRLFFSMLRRFPRLLARPRTETRSTSRPPTSPPTRPPTRDVT